MKATHAILLLSLCFCACSRQVAEPASKLDQIQAGKDIRLGDYTLHVDKRTGNFIEGVRIINKESDGQMANIVADSGTLSLVSNQPVIQVILHGVRLEKAAQKVSINELTINLPAWSHDISAVLPIVGALVGAYRH